MKNYNFKVKNLANPIFKFLNSRVFFHAYFYSVFININSYIFSILSLDF
ncbi:hypothetical protein HMPREF0072_1180 [Anaerococcus lactolyticus ATCC 51172]|uniref:Uncharacterized protein n=1 Tax=Anaerococcus lactolyticus ATCC 51172 TaxID=525254 RepID=C2BFR0_9FIRM|nr:hypothetical protein HMPREF0072_1180 [Anaerococcus lactolyticus ATCC 51172]